MKLLDILNKIHPLPPEDGLLLENIFQETGWTKGTILFNQDKTEDKFYFIKSGVARAYSINDGNELTFWFGQEGQPVLSMQSYINQKSGYESIEILEDAILYQTSITALTQLYEKHLSIANWGRKLAENELMATEQRFIARQIGTAAQRYHLLLTSHPGLINRVQLSYIASYLGITQVSLSRIRNGKQ